MERKIYPSSQQKFLLVQLVSADPELRRGKCSSTFSKQEMERRWQAIAHQLNALGGARKTWEGWRKCWQDKKCKSKVKLAKLKRLESMLAGKTLPEPLNEDHQWFLNTMFKHSLFGHKEPNESMLEFVDLNKQSDSKDTQDVAQCAAVPGSSQTQSGASEPAALPGTLRSRDSNENSNLQKESPPDTAESPPNNKESDPNDEELHPDTDYAEEEPMIEIPKSSIPLYVETTLPTPVDPFVVSQTELRSGNTEELIRREAVLRVECAELRIKNEKELSEIRLASEKLKQVTEKLKHGNLRLEMERNKVLLEKAKLELQRMKCRIQLPTRKVMVARLQK